MVRWKFLINSLRGGVICNNVIKQPRDCNNLPLNNKFIRSEKYVIKFDYNIFGAVINCVLGGIDIGNNAISLG